MRIRSAVHFAAILLLGTGAWAQDAPRVELGFDYSFSRYAPSASYTKGHSLNGGGGNIMFNFGQYFGIMADFQGYNSNTTQFVIPANDQFPSGANGSVSGNLFTYLFGPVVKFRGYPHVHPYLDVLLGAAHSNVYGNAYKTICQPVAGACSTNQTPDSNAFAMTAGGGLDIPINSYIDLRVGQFDYLYTRFTNIFNDAGQNNFRYLTGLNIKMGLPSVTSPTIACAVEPAEVLPWAGPVKATATPSAFHPKHTITYSWESSGGKAEGAGDSATVDTTSLAPGQYTLRASAIDPKQKKNNTATCTASFTVKQPRPPVVACSASPATVKPGDPIAITVSGSSPELSAIEKHAFSVSSGTIKEGETQHGTQPGEFTQSATLETKDVAPGPITVDVAVTDVHGLSTTCTANAEIVAPEVAPPAPTPTAQLVGNCNFNDARRPGYVDNQCKAVLDGVALRLKQETGSRLILVGFADKASGAKGETAQAVRAIHVRDYLIKGEGKADIDTTRIQIRQTTERNSENAVHIFFVPEELTGFEVENTAPIDESKVTSRRPK